jgi:signal transduction histidine kinase
MEFMAVESNKSAGTEPEGSQIDDSKQLQQSLEELLRFEQFFFELSTAFVSLSAAEVDQAIRQWLKKLAEFLEIDSCNISELTPDGSGYYITHFYHIPGFRDPPIRSSHVVPWYTEQLKNDEILVIKRLPKHVPADQAVLWKDIRLHVAVPLKVGKSSLGSISFSSLSKKQDWSEELLQRLRLIGEVFANALERKRVESEIQKKRDELAHVARVAMLDELAASLAHEINQPLTAILSNAHAAQRFLSLDKPDITEVRDALADIIKDNWRASEVIKRMRDLVKKKGSEKSTVDVNHTIQDVAVLIRNDADQKSIPLILDLGAALPPVTGDRIQLQQVILNLVLNGFSAIEQSQDINRELKIKSTFDTAGMVVISVADSGIGMDSQTMNHMFEAFFTTRSEGMGMGLSICRTIVESHGGQIWGEPNPHRGMSFFFSLPV